MLTQDDVIYFVVTDRFCDGDPGNNRDVDLTNPRAYHGGDFAGIVKKIPYLKNLGITTLWITPVYRNIPPLKNGHCGYHGYWPLDFDSVDPHLYTPKPGVPEGSRIYLKELADELHANGIKLILDMVVNHTGYAHPGLRDDPSTPFRTTWFNAEYLVSDEEGRMWGLPDIDQDNPEVIDYFIRSILDWIAETGIDCVRMDTVKHVEKAFWYAYKTYVKGKYPEVSLLGEVLESDIDRLSEYQRHFAFDSLFDFPLQFAMHDIFVSDLGFTRVAQPRLSPQEFPGLLDRDSHYTNHNRLVTLLDNHDLPKRFVTEIMDRHSGDRDLSVKILRLALTFLLTTRGIPQIYYGTEIALEGRSDPDNRRDMPWEVFGDGLEPLPAHTVEAGTFEYLKGLIAFRKAHDAVKYGSLNTLYSDNFIYVYLREFRDDLVIVALNNGYEAMPEPLSVHVGHNMRLSPSVRGALMNARLKNALPGGEDIVVTDGVLNILLGGKEGVVLSIE